MTRVAIIVLNWNGIEDTITCLDSLLRQDYSEYKVVVIDNGSTDDSAKILRQYENEHSNIVTALYNQDNLGFDGGVNTGIRWALERNFDAIALLNNDAVADEKWLSYLLAGLETEEVGISTGLLLSHDGKTIDTTGEQYSKWGLPFPRNRGDKAEASPDSELVFGATGGATLYRSSLFKDIGTFDEDFFAYYEDVDISFRAQLAGWKVSYNPRAIAYHKQGATSNKLPGFAVYQTFKNMPLLFIKNVPCKLLVPIGVRFYTAYILMYFKTFLHGSGWKATKGAWMSFALGFKALNKRHNIQKNRKVSLDYIKNIIWDDLPPDQVGLRKLRKLLTGIG